MKKVLFMFVAAIMMLAAVSCTENTRARIYGGDMTINLQPGEKLVEVTWKENNIWYLVEPMDSDYTPKTKIFKEDSRFGVMNGTVKFIETR